MRLANWAILTFTNWGIKKQCVAQVCWTPGLVACIGQIGAALRAWAVIIWLANEGRKKHGPWSDDPIMGIKQSRDESCLRRLIVHISNPASCLTLIPILYVPDLIPTQCAVCCPQYFSLFCLSRLPRETGSEKRLFSFFFVLYVSYRFVSFCLQKSDITF